MQNALRRYIVYPNPKNNSNLTIHLTYFIKRMKIYFILQFLSLFKMQRKYWNFANDFLKFN